MAVILIVFVAIAVIMLFIIGSNLNKKESEQLRINVQLAENDYFMYLNSEQAKSENFLYKDYLLEKVKHAQRALDLLTHRQKTYGSSDNSGIYTDDEGNTRSTSDGSHLY